jgi:hypothetical protein
MLGRYPQLTRVALPREATLVRTPSGQLFESKGYFDYTVLVGKYIVYGSDEYDTLDYFEVTPVEPIDDGVHDVSALAYPPITATASALMLIEALRLVGELSDLL